MIGPESEIAIRTRGKIRIGCSVVERARSPVDQRSVIRSLIVLRQRVEAVLEPVGAGKLTIKRVKAPVFLVDHNDVPQPFHSVLALALVAWRRGKRHAAGTDENCRSG